MKTFSAELKINDTFVFTHIKAQRRRIALKTFRQIDPECRIRDIFKPGDAVRVRKA